MVFEFKIVGFFRGVGQARAAAANVQKMCTMIKKMSITLMSPSLSDQLLLKTHFCLKSNDSAAHILWSRTRDATLPQHIRKKSTHTNLRMPVTVNDKLKFARIMQGSKFVPAGYVAGSNKMYVVKPRHQANSEGILFTTSPKNVKNCDVQEFVSSIRTFRDRKFVARFLYLWVPTCGWRIAKNGPIVIADEPYCPTDLRSEVQLPQRFVHDVCAADIIHAEDYKRINQLGLDLFKRLETLNVQQMRHTKRFDIYGLDLLFTENGVFMLEINTYFSLDWDDSTHIIVDVMQELFDELVRM